MVRRHRPRKRQRRNLPTKTAAEATAEKDPKPTRRHWDLYFDELEREV